jgi:predicted  nucleic acid-binding Zn-ribbon protein
MEQREQAQGVLDEALRRLAAAGEQRTAAEQRRDEALTAIAKEEEFRTSGRRPLAADLPADLVALYERIREQSGMGAALLRAGRCGGCRLELSGGERSRVRSAPADEIVRCEECRRILVRTEESDL